MNNKEIVDKIKNLKWFTLRDLIMVLIGIALSFTIAKGVYDWKMSEAITLQGLVYKHIVYDVKLRP